MILAIKRPFPALGDWLSRVGVTQFVGLDMAKADIGVVRLTAATPPRVQPLLIRSRDVGSHPRRYADAINQILTFACGLLQAPAELQPWDYYPVRMPTLALIEGYAFAAEVENARLGEIGGLLRFALWNIGIPYIEVPPSRAKKYVFGGAAQKDKLLLHIFKTWGLEFETSHEGDAFSLARLGLGLIGGETKLVKAREQVIQATLQLPVFLPKGW